MADELPPVVAVLRARNAEFLASMKEATAATKKVADETGKTSTVSKSHFERMAGAGKAMALGIVGAGVVIGGAALKMGMDFQESMTTLITGAGESQKNIGMVGDGILNMSGKVGQSSKSLADGMYLVESAGYHGADGLKVLQAAAEGAKVGNADMKTVADGVTTALTDYGLKASDAATVTSKLVTTVASGKTTMQALAGSLSNVLPTAKGAKVGLDQVLAAMATMTGQGISADQASQNLANTIRSLSAPSNVASHAMAAIGINSTDLAKNLGKKGLTGTLDEVYTAIMHHMGPSGLVLEDAFTKSKLAAQSAKEMITQLPASLQKLATGYLGGTVTAKEWSSALKGQPAIVANLGKQFATVAKHATGFSDSLKSGSGSAHTFNDTLSKVMGGATGMNTALALTGGNMATFKANVQGISGATAEADGSVKGFAETQKDLKTKLENAKFGVEAMVTKLGMALIPVVTKVITVVTKWGDWLVKHKPILIAFAAVVGTVVVTAILAYVASLVAAGVTSVIAFAKMIGSGAKWVAESAIQFATWIAKSAVAFGVWIAQTTASMAESAALWAMYFAEWIAKQATALAESTATMVTGMAEWVAAQAVGFAKAAAGAAIWIAEHVAMAAAAVVQYGIMAAAATAAFIAENAATLGIIAAIALVIAAAVFLATHWKQVWQAICDAASWAYHNVILPVAHWIMGNVIDPIQSAIGTLGAIWGRIWSAIGGAVKAGAAIIAGAIGGIIGAISTVIGWIQTAIGWFSQLFASANSAATAASKATAASSGASAGMNPVTGTHFAGGYKKYGGWIPGGRDQLVPTGMHGGEYALSVDMIEGRQAIDPKVVAAISGNRATSKNALNSGAPAPKSAGGAQVTVIAQTNASPHRIGAEVGWVLRGMA